MNMTMEAISAQIGSELFDRILNADTPVLVLETQQSEALIEQFRQLVRRSGQTVYLWREGEGLCSLRESGVRVPGCLRVSDTLRYVHKSMRFGIYLMAGIKPPLQPTHLSLLQRIGRTQAAFVRRVVLLGEGSELAASLGELATVLRHEEVVQMKPRLRDGRWVV